MNARNTIYWTATILTAFSFLSGGAATLYRVDETSTSSPSSGRGSLGGVANLAPRLPGLKAWAYAGIAFDLTHAAVSHIAMAHPAVKVIVPLVLLGIAAASRELRPASRWLGGVHLLGNGPVWRWDVDRQALRFV